MSDFKAKMHKIRFPPRLRPRPHWGSLQYVYLSGLLLRGRGNMGDGGRGGKGKGNGRRGEGRGGEGRKGQWSGPSSKYFGLEPLP